MNSASRHLVLEEPAVALGIKLHAVKTPATVSICGFDADYTGEVSADAGFSGIFTLVSRPVAAMGGVLFRANTAGEFAMYKSMQLRWIEQAEGRSVREHVGLQRAESEPHIGIACTTTGSARVEWLRELLRILRRVIASGRSPPLDATASVKKKCPPFALRLLSTEVDYDRVLVAVLITDIVDSTKRVAEIGDRDWRVLLDRHDNTTRYQIKRFGGREVGNHGDGFVSIFDSPARAVRCAAAIGDMIAPLGILVRSGIHVGELYLKGEEIRGIAVHIAARIAATAHPGEAFVSKTVRDLVAGSGLVFEDRGIHQLRGLPEEIHLYAMRPVGAPPTPASSV